MLWNEFEKTENTLTHCIHALTIWTYAQTIKLFIGWNRKYAFVNAIINIGWLKCCTHHATKISALCSNVCDEHSRRTLLNFSGNVRCNNHSYAQQGREFTTRFLRNDETLTQCCEIQHNCLFMLKTKDALLSIVHNAAQATTCTTLNRLNHQPTDWWSKHRLICSNAATLYARKRCTSFKKCRTPSTRPTWEHTFGHNSFDLDSVHMQILSQG